MTLVPVDPALVEAATARGPEDAAARHAELVGAVERANRLYYEEDAPELSDAEYDALFRELVALETAFPALRSPAGQRSGWMAVSGAGSMSPSRSRSVPAASSSAGRCCGRSRQAGSPV